MDSNRYKSAAEWFRSVVYQDETISRRPAPRREKLPPLLMTARSLETGKAALYQSRESLFVKQAKLLVNYEDDCPFNAPAQQYFSTYAALTDRELRGYFTWRTRFRRGQVEKTAPTFAYIYLYELINGIGMSDPLDGYRKLEHFRDVYCPLDENILWNLETWMADYVVYYGLDPALLADTEGGCRDRLIHIFETIPEREDQQILEAVNGLIPSVLSRSRFYKAYPQDMEQVTIRVLRKMWDHYSRCRHPLAEQLFGPRRENPVWLFSSAVFLREKKEESREYRVSPIRCYRCRRGLWFVEEYGSTDQAESQLRTLIKAIDAEMRILYEYPYPLKRPLDTKWLLAAIREETQALLDAKKAAEVKKITIDYSRLEQIRRDAAVTQDRLTVEEDVLPEEEMPEPAPAETPQPVQEELLPLEEAEVRLLRCLLYGSDLSWVRQSGKPMSVLADAINEKLYDTFSDAVLTVDDPPEIIEDYLDELKEMVRP